MIFINIEINRQNFGGLFFIMPHIYIIREFLRINIQWGYKNG